MSKLSDVIQVGTTGGLPAANSVPVGTLYSENDNGNTIYRSNGTTWDQFSATGGGTLVAPLALSNANFDNGNTTPLDIIAAPGANKVIVPISVAIYTNVTVTKAANPTLRLRWNGDTTDLIGVAINMQLNSTGEWWRHVTCGQATAISLAFGSFDARNKSLQWSASANTSTGTATGKLRVVYTVYDIS